jgi:hypothetical protein
MAPQSQQESPIPCWDRTLIGHDRADRGMSGRLRSGACHRPLTGQVSEELIEQPVEVDLPLVDLDAVVGEVLRRSPRAELGVLITG